MSTVATPRWFSVILIAAVIENVCMYAWCSAEILK